MKYIFLVTLSIIFWADSHAQEVLVNNPASLKWYKVETPNFIVLFPSGFEKEAQRMANSLETIRSKESVSMGGNTRKISVVLQSQSAESNGFVTMVPRHSEFYAMPSQDYNFSGTNDWLNMLASHEFRHVVQFDVARRGFNKALYYLFGPATYSAMAQTSIPQWFWEGDAVVTETNFTNSGRGSIPNFGLVFRTNLLEGRSFNYHKQYLRSYKDFIPNHYVLGYHMVSYLRSRTGNAHIWEDITKRTWSVPFIPFAFSNSIKKETGLYVTDLYNEMAGDLKQKWQSEIDTLEMTPFQPLSHNRRRGYTNYNFPQVLDSDKVLVMKEGIGDIEQFVILSGGTEKKTFTLGFINESGMLSTSGAWVVWNEYSFDPRWRVKNYSVIKMYNTDTRELKRVTTKTRYAGAALSPDQSKIATVETTTSYATTLIVIDTAGNRIREFPNPENNFYSMARWSDDGLKIVSLKTTQNGRSVVSIDFSSGKETQLVPESDENIGHPVLYKDYLLFNSGITGIDNIYAIDLESGQRMQVTCSKYGAYNPCVSKDGNEIYYNEQTRDGFDVVKTSFAPSTWKKMNHPVHPEALFDKMRNQEGQNLFKDLSIQQYPASRYHRTSGLLTPYSWGAVFDNSFTNLHIGLSSKDVLSTTSINAGYLFDIYERTGAWYAGLSYQGWYPIVDVNFKYSKRSVDEGNVGLYNVNTATNDTTIISRNVTFEWTEKNLEAGLRLPLLTTRSKYYGSVTFSNYVGYSQVTDFHNSLNNGRFIPVYLVDGELTGNSGYPFFDYVDDSNLIYNHFSFSAYRLLKTSKRDINSRWGQSVYFDYFNTPYGKGLKGSLFSFLGVLYMPGLMKHHSLWGYWAYQHTSVASSLNDYIFRNNIPAPRGHSFYRFEKFYTMSANYTFPLVYPDIAIGPFLNIQRIRANAFFDYGFGDKVLYYNITNQAYASVGGELKVDFNVMRALPQLNMGIRYSYGLKPSVTKFEVLIGTVNF